jgi:hypothetical protein
LYGSDQGFHGIIYKSRSFLSIEHPWLVRRTFQYIETL